MRNGSKKRSAVAEMAQLYFEQQLCDAAERGDIKTVAKYIADQVSANSRDPIGVSALSKAAKSKWSYSAQSNFQRVLRSPSLLSFQMAIWKL